MGWPLISPFEEEQARHGFARFESGVDCILRTPEFAGPELGSGALPKRPAAIQLKFPKRRSQPVSVLIAWTLIPCRCSSFSSCTSFPLNESRNILHAELTPVYHIRGWGKFNRHKLFQRDRSMVLVTEGLGPVANENQLATIAGTRTAGEVLGGANFELPRTERFEPLHVPSLGRETLGPLLVAQAIDGVKVCRHGCRVIAEEQAHADGDRKTDRHPDIRQRCRN